MICERCSTSFEPRKSWHRFCTERCQDAALKAGRSGSFERPFVAFDGEGWDARYTILADSTGRQIASPAGLSTTDCLEFLLRSQTRVSNVWFGAGYDVNMILGDLPMYGARGSLELLHAQGNVQWGRYYIRYLPRKQLLISDGKRSYNSYDALGFFQCGFEKVLADWIGEVPDLISWGKANRDRFEEIALEPGGFDKIAAYNQLECELLVEIMTRLRDAMREADLKVSRWDGAGAIAAAWCKRNGIDRFYGSWPEAMNEAVASAFFGGNINVLGIGRAECAGFDIGSAYPAGVAACPDLSLTSWHLERVSKVPDVPYSIVQLGWDVSHPWPPLPYRRPIGTILYPPQGTGWYYAVEAAAAVERFGRRIRPMQAWLPDAISTQRPLESTIRADYDQRLAFKAQGRPAQIVVKLALNAIFGKTAQTVSWNGGRPKFQNLLWAGYITAQTRAKVQLAIAQARKVYAIATDGIFADVNLPTGTGLGDWTREPIVAVDVLGAGLYQTYGVDGTPAKHKQRGFSQEPLEYEATLARWLGGDGSPEPIDLRRFVGMGLALSQPTSFYDSFRRFVDIRKDLACPLLEGTTKRLPEQLGRRGSFVELDPRPAPDPSRPSAPYRKIVWDHEPMYECVE